LRHYSVGCACGQRHAADQRTDQAVSSDRRNHQEQALKQGRHPSLAAHSQQRLYHSRRFVPADRRAQIRDEARQRQGRIGFVDSYKYNIAAYRLAELLELDDMLPVYVERKCKARPVRSAGISPTRWTMSSASKRKIEPPDPDKWNKQMYRIRVSDELIYDTDPNLTNVLIGEDWTVWRVDFSRAFRTNKDLRVPKTGEMRPTALRKTENPQSRRSGEKPKTI